MQNMSVVSLGAMTPIHSLNHGGSGTTFLLRSLSRIATLPREGLNSRHRAQHLHIPGLLFSSKLMRSQFCRDQKTRILEALERSKVGCTSINCLYLNCSRFHRCLTMGKTLTSLMPAKQGLQTYHRSQHPHILGLLLSSKLVSSQFCRNQKSRILEALERSTAGSTSISFLYLNCSRVHRYLATSET
jgi:hypothetical protein